jgi:hypothetical protein
MIHDWQIQKSFLVKILCRWMPPEMVVESPQTPWDDKVDGKSQVDPEFEKRGRSVECWYDDV